MQTTAFSGPPAPERSPLEPTRSFSTRIKKWRRDNAKWEGQRRAIQTLDRKQTPIPPTISPGSS